MSTFTSNFRFEKPELSDPADVDVLRDNIHHAAHTLQAIDLCTNAGFAERDVSSQYIVADGNPVSADTNSDTWYMWDSAASIWYTAGNHTMGRIYTYSSQNNYQFEHPGIYKVAYNLRVQTSGVTSTEGSLRAAVYYYYGTPDPPVYIPATHRVVPIDTRAGYTDIFCEALVYVSEYNEIDRPVYNYGDDVHYSTNYDNTPDYQWEVRWGHTNSNSDTAIVKGGGASWFSAEFVRPL